MSFPYIDLWIEAASDKLKRPSVDYVDAIRRWLQDQSKNWRVQNYVKIFALSEEDARRASYYGNASSFGSLVSKIYEGPLVPLEEAKGKHIDTLFQVERDRLWEMCRVVDSEPESIRRLGQPAQIGLLLYGPPGTGKSSFAYRVAMALGRHIVAIDIRTLPNRKTLHELMHKPVWDGKAHGAHEIVYIFDEFDLTVKELAAREKVNARVKTEFFARDWSSADMKSSSTRLSSTGFGKEDEIQLRDLLDVFSGVVPVDRGIFMATTNKFDELSKLCPELFRPQRLTPVLFDHIDFKLVDEISRFHFQRVFAFDQKVTVERVCPSLLIQVLLESVSMVKGEGKEAQHAYFQRRLNSILLDAANGGAFSTHVTLAAKAAYPAAEPPITVASGSAPPVVVVAS